MMYKRIRKHIAFLSISSVGFIFLFVYLYYDYVEYFEQGNAVHKLIEHLTDTQFRAILMHSMIFIAPLITTIIGFLYERTLIYKKDLEQKIEERTASLKASEDSFRRLSEGLEHKVVERTKELEESAHYWKDTFDSTPYGVFIVDKDYKILRLNKYITQLLGKNYDEIEGKRCYEIFHSSDKPVKGCPFEKTILSEKLESSEFYEPAIGRYLWMHINPVIHGGNIEAFVHSVVDITEIREKEKSLEKSKDAFLNMLRDIHESYNELKELFISLIRAFVHALDAKSPWTKGHSERVTMFATQIAEEIGMGREDIEDLGIAALLHDIGKIGTYDYLLDKPARLTNEEFEMVKRHPATAIEIIKDIKQLQRILPIIMHHHERYDGNGYPAGLKGEDIPLGSRILCVADSFDSMTADRPYRPSQGINYAKLELKKCSGTQFDPKLVEVFLKVLSH